MDISGQHSKEHRSLDIVNLLNLSANAQERKSACPARRKNLVIKASTREYEIRNGSPVIISETVVPANFVQNKEARIPSAFQVETASPEKICPSAHVTHNSAFDGINSEVDQRKTTNEQELSVLDLLDDDVLNGNMEGNPVHEAHVAFSVEGLGKVGMETPVHSPQQHSRTFSYGISSPSKAAGRHKLSKKFNTLMDDLEFEVDPMMEDINVPPSSSYMEFSPDIIDSLSSPKHNSFGVRDCWKQDSYSSKRNSFFGHRIEDKWNGECTFPDHSFFDEREHDIAMKTWQSRIEDSSADNLIYRNSNYDMSDFAFEGPCQTVRAVDRVPDKFGILESPFSYSRHQTSEYDRDFLISNWERPSTVERNFDFKPVTSQTDQFFFMTEDPQDNSSLQSEESCSSTAVRYQATDNSLPNSTSRLGKRGPGSAFAGSGDKCGSMKAFADENKDDSQQENMAGGSGKRTNMLNVPKSKASHLSSSFFQESLGTKDIWFFEEAYTTVDMNLGSSSFNQNSGTKHTRFDLELWDKDPFSKVPTLKSHVRATPSCDRFNCEPVECSPSKCFTPKIPFHASSISPKPDFHPDSELRTMPQDSSYIACSQGEAPSPDLSAQESFSKVVECEPKFKPSNCGVSELEEETCVRNECLVCEDKEAKCASYPQDNEHEGRNEDLPDPMEETSPSVDITDRSGNPKDDDEDHHADKTPLPYKNLKEEVEDFGSEGRFGSKQKSAYVDSSCQAMMLQSYVFQFFCVQKRLKLSSTANAVKMASESFLASKR